MRFFFVLGIAFAPGEFRRPAHAGGAEDLGESAVELFPGVAQSGLAWTIPEEPDYKFCEFCDSANDRRGCECVCEFFNSWTFFPCVKINFEKITDFDLLSVISVFPVRLFPDHSSLRRLCRDARKAVLRVLRNIVRLEAQFAVRPQPEDIFERKYAAYLKDSVVVPLENLDVHLKAKLILLSDGLNTKIQILIPIDMLTEVRTHFEELIYKKEPMFSEWSLIAYIARNKLRFIADRLTFAMNEAPFWSCMVDGGCYLRRQTVNIETIRN